MAGSRGKRYLACGDPKHATTTDVTRKREPIAIPTSRSFGFSIIRRQPTSAAKAPKPGKPNGAAKGCAAIRC